MPLKALDDNGSGLDSTLAPAIKYAADNGADVINASWVSRLSPQTIAEAVDYAYNLGVVLVAAAGNDGKDVMAEMASPACLWDVIAVAASDPNGQIASFSNWGSKIDVAAPGVDILSLRAAGTSMGTPLNDGYTRVSGTSMAAPHVSGLAALILAKHPEYSNEDVRQALRVSADQVGQPGFDMHFGYGRIDASAAVAVSGALEVKISSPADGTIAQSPVTISGVARGTGFASYKLEYGVGSEPSAWTMLQTGNSPVSGTLGVFDATAVPDGTYTIRLTAYDTAGQAFVDQIEVIAAAVAITSPLPAPVPPAATTFKPGVTIPISGTAIAAGFQSFQIAWARGVNPGSGWQTTGITLVNGGMTSVTNGALATWDTSSITQADYYTIQLTVTAAGFTNTASTMVYLEPDLLSPNWPQWLDGATDSLSGVVPAADSAGNIYLALSSQLWNGPPWAKFWSFSPDGSSQTTVNLNQGGAFEPAAGSLDGGAGDELVVPDGGVLDIFNPNGTYSATTFSIPTGLDFSYTQVVLDDINGDSQLETVAYGGGYYPRPSYVFAWRSNGQQLNPNFPIPIADSGQEILGGIRIGIGDYQRVLVGDVDGDGKKEMVVLQGVPGGYIPQLYGLDGLPRQWNAPSGASPGMMALADLDHNGKLELVISDYGFLHVLQPDGSERPGWPRYLLSEIDGMGLFAIGDLNRDGHYEIVAWGPHGLNVFNADGTSFSGAFPWLPPSGGGNGPVVLADINGDGYPEIITTYGFGPFTLVAIDHNGNIVRSWNLIGAKGQIPCGQPVITVGDFNRDGLTEIAMSYTVCPAGGLASGGLVTVLQTGAPFNPAANDWPMIYQNPQNNPVLQPSGASSSCPAGLSGAPAFTAAGVVNAASQKANGGVAPGEIVSIFGCGLGPPPAGAQAASPDPKTGSLPATLGNVTVTFDSVAAPLLFVDASQLDVEVPLDVSGKSSTTVVVQYGGASSAPVPVPVTVASPGAFTWDYNGNQRLIAVNPDNSLNTPLHPAQPGDSVTIYLTGQGQGIFLGMPSGRVAVQIGGEPAHSWFQNLMPGFEGVLQIHVTIPNDATPGEAPIDISVGGVHAQPGLTISVK